MLSFDFSLIAITETWLNNGVLDGEILPNNYTIYRRDRASRGGGVLLAVNNNLSSRQFSSSDDIESIVVEISSGCKSFVLMQMILIINIFQMYYIVCLSIRIC